MIHLYPALVAIVCTVTNPALAQTEQQPKAPGIEAKGYQWNRPRDEQTRALKLKGDAERGRIAFEVCQGCHKPDGSGRPDGSYPQLAGQHETVLVKQLVDVRAGVRDNPKMHPFAGARVISVEEIADIAAFLHRLPVPADNGKGKGDALPRAKALYAKDCESCHGENGEGSAEKFYPIVASQHYLYLLRETRDIRDGKRRNANPKMVKVVKKFSDADMEAVSDYISRLSLPVRESAAK